MKSFTGKLNATQTLGAQSSKNYIESQQMTETTR